MKFSSPFTPLAHSYVIEGDAPKVVLELISLLEKEHGISFKGNPDVFKEVYGTFTIENAREIKDHASKKKIGEGKRVFIISSDTITREASNALLKTLEEPGKDTHFFLIIPSIKKILPTILSRVRVVKFSTDKTNDTIDEFINASKAARLQIAKDMLSKLEKEHLSKGDIATFIEGIVQHKYQTKGKKNNAGLEKEALIASYSRDQSVSLKMILEYLALVA